MIARAAPRLSLLLLCAVLLSACSGGKAPEPAPSSGPTPAIGGPPVVRTSPPSHAMNKMERPVATQLARQLARQGLRLTYLDCPPWNGVVPSRMTCRGYVDGLVTDVRVVFTRAVPGKAIGFDAQLTRGVIATRNLEATLERQGWSDPDCGDVPAYPARVGSRIVCRAARHDGKRYVVATIRSRTGEVSVAEYRRSSGTG